MNVLEFARLLLLSLLLPGLLANPSVCIPIPPVLYVLYVFPTGQMTRPGAFTEELATMLRQCMNMLERLSPGVDTMEKACVMSNLGA